MKLTIRRKEDAKGRYFHTGNYDFLLDGEQIRAGRLKNIDLKLNAGESPKLTLEYLVDEVEIEEVDARVFKQLIEEQCKADRSRGVN